MKASLCTDLRRVSSNTSTSYEGALTRSLRSSFEQLPWLTAAEQLSLFPTKRCVMMKPADWQELSQLLSNINTQCTAAKATSSGKGISISEQGSSDPKFVAILELLLRLGQVTSCLLCVNGDDRSFSIARVAQAIRMTTSVLEAAIAQAIPAGLSAEVADSLARQRCEQTPLLSAVTWALRQEARSLFFNPRPTALSLATALLDFFREVEQLWPRGIFVPQQHESCLDAAAAHMADPAAQLALAMLRCAGRAMADVGPGACRESLICGLRVGYDMVQQISVLLDAGLLPSHEGLVKQLQQSPSLPQLMLALLAVETFRLNKQLGVSETDSCILLQPKRGQPDRLEQQQPSKRLSRSDHTAATANTSSPAQQQGVADSQLQPRPSSADSIQQSRRSSAADTPAVSQDPQQQQGQPLAVLHRSLSQQRLLQQQQLRQQQQEEEEHQEMEGAGELHQVWHQVLGMARKNLARDGETEQQDDAPRSPLMQLWVSLGLPEGLLQIAADAGVSPAPPAQQYIAVCRVGKFLLQGSPLLQPQHGATAHGDLRPPSPRAATAAVGGTVAVQPPVAGNSHPGGITLQLSASAAAAGAGAGQLSPFAGLARSVSRTQSFKGAGAVPQAWQSGSPADMFPSGIASTPSGAAIAASFSVGADPYNRPGSVSSLSPRDTLQVGACFSVSAEAAEQLMDACRDTGLRGQEQLELLRLQRVVPVVLLNTAASLLQRQAGKSEKGVLTGPNNSSSSSSSGGGQRSCEKLSAKEELRVVHAACMAAACVSRCWPVLQKVAEQQEELVELLAECHPPAGVYAGLTSVAWRPYTLPTEVRLPVLQLLQLVVKLIWQLQPAWQQQQQQRVDYPAGSAAEAGSNGHAAAVLAAAVPRSSTASVTNSSDSSQILSPVSGECLDSLLEVLTAVSKLPWEPHHELHSHTHRDHHHSHGVIHSVRDLDSVRDPASVRGMDDAASDASSVQSVGDVDAHLVAEAWQQECQPVAAAVEACLRTAGQVAAAADGTLDWRPGGLISNRSATAVANGATAAAAADGADGVTAAGAVAPKVQRHPSAVALGSCLASLCAPFGRPGPLVAAAAAAQPGGPEQQQLFALYVSKLKVLLYNPASKKASLIAMHPIEQTPIYIIQQLCASSSSSALTASDSSHSAAPAAQQEGPVSAALLPWLLLLSRLMVLRGKFLGHLLANEADESGKAGATSSLHTAYWHVKMAHESASTLAAQLKGALCPGLAGLPSEPLLALQQQQERARVQSDLQLQLLPALKQAVQVLRAAMKLSRHYHETGFASGFSAGFAAGYAAAVAAVSGVNGSGPTAPGPVSFASPWGVLQQCCIRVLPKQLEAVGASLAWQLRHVGCSNPLCVNMSLGSELWLNPEAADSSSQQGGNARSGSEAEQVMGGVVPAVRAALCSACSKGLGLPASG